MFHLSTNRPYVSAALIRAIAALGTFGFVAWISVKAFSEVRFDSIDLSMLALSTAFYAASVAALPLFWVILLRAYAPDWTARASKGFLELALVYSRSWIARYVPGRIWMFGGRVLYGSALGIPKWTVLKSTIVEGLILQAITLWLAVMMVMMYFGQWLAVTGIAVLAPILFAIYLRKSHRLITVVPIERVRDLMTLPANRSTIVAFVYGVLLNISLLVSVTLLAVAVLGVDIKTASMIAGLWGISVVAGFITTVTPAGLGVREAVGVVLLSTIIDRPDAVLFMSVGRGVSLIVDFVLAGAVELYFHAAKLKKTDRFTPVDTVGVQDQPTS